MPTDRNQFTPVPTPSAATLLFVVFLFVVVLTLPQRPQTKQAHAATSGVPGLEPATPGQPISLRDRLVTGLQARLKSELKFVDAVVEKVNKGQLPQRLVDETFFWARETTLRKRQFRREQRPIIYFQPALIARAERLKIKL